MTRGRLLRGVAVTVISSVVLLSGAAQPAQAIGEGQIVRFTINVIGKLAFEAAGGVGADELQALWRDTQAALIEARNEIIDHSDRLEVADVKAELRKVAVDATLLNPSYPSQDARLSYARMAMHVGTSAGAKQREMRTAEAVHEMGIAMLVGYETGIVAYMTQRPPLQVEAATVFFKRDLEFLIERLGNSPECPTPTLFPDLQHTLRHECRGFGAVASGEERCSFPVIEDYCPEYEHRYQAEDGGWEPWTSGRLDQRVLKDEILKNTIFDAAVVTYADLLVFMDEMGFN